MRKLLLERHTKKWGLRSSLFNVYSGKECYNKYPNGDEIYNASSIFISNDYEGEVVLDGEESADALFFKKVDIPSLEEVNPPDRIVIKDIIEKLKIEKYI